MADTAAAHSIEDAAAVVLAGGRSTRFGRDKATTRLNSITLTERVIERLRPLFGENIMVGVKSLPHPLEGLLGRYRLIEDLIEADTPLVGIYTALRHTDKQWLFVVACDMVLIEQNLISLLAERRKAACHCVVPLVDGLLQPLLAFYNRTTLPFMESYLGSGGRSLKGFLGIEGLNRVYIDEEEIRRVDPLLLSFKDIDRVEDLRAVEKILKEEDR